jgi:hypothetical protein
LNSHARSRRHARRVPPPLCCSSFLFIPARPHSVVVRVLADDPVGVDLDVRLGNHAAGAGIARRLSCETQLVYFLVFPSEVGGGCNHMPEELEKVKDGNVL